MSGNTSTVVPNCQFQNDVVSYSNISNPTEYNNTVNTSYYHEYSNEYSNWIHANYSMNDLNTQQQHMIQHQNPQITDHNFYHPNSSQIYDNYNYDINGQIARQDVRYIQKMNSNDAPISIWQQYEANQSNNNQQTIDPCAQVVQVLQCYHQGGEEPEFVRKAIESLVKKLKDKRAELDALISAVTNSGKEQTICVTIQRSLDGRLQVAGKKGVPHVVYARIWRWPKINKNELKKMDICTIPNDHPDLICINPYHYERVISSNYGNIDMNINQQIRPTSHEYMQSESMNLNSIYTNDIPKDHRFLTKSDAFKGSNEQSYITSDGQNGYKQRYYSEISSNYQQLPHHITDIPRSNATFFMYGNTQQPNYIMKHFKDGSTSLVNNSLPSFSNDDSGWKRYQYSNVDGNNLIIERYNTIRQIMVNNKLQEKDMGLSDWCSINYYELDTQIGETYHVPFDHDEITIDGGTDLGGCRNGRFCLGALSNVHRTEASERARAGIGRGIKLMHCPDGSVILQCNTLKDIFIRSYYLDFEGNMVYGSTVHKFENGANKKVFDLHWAYLEMSEQAMAEQRAYAEQAQAVAGSRPISMVDRSIVSIDDLRRVCCTIAISFVKGWGAGYNRSSLKDTPCWVELQLHRPLKLLNKLIQS